MFDNTVKEKKKFILQKLHIGQQYIYEHMKRFTVLACGRRFGKTEFCIYIVIKILLKGGRVGWVAPTYKLITAVYYFIANYFEGEIDRKNEQHHYIYLKNGGQIEFWSIDNNEDVGRSKWYNLVVIDEAGMIKNLWKIWQSAIKLTLMDYQGSAIFAGTPKGRNGFYKAFVLGSNNNKKDWVSFSAKTGANPFIKPDEIESMMEDMSQELIEQEIEAKFLDDSGSVFKNVSVVSTEEMLDAGLEGHKYIMAIDPARVNDFFVISIMDKESKTQVYMDRFQGLDIKPSYERVKTVYELFKPELIAIETNQYRGLYELLRDDGLPVTEVITTNELKHAMIDALALAIQLNQIKLLDNNIQRSELMAYEVERLDSGRMRFGAPVGYHDDTVVSLSINHWYVKQQDYSALDRIYGVKDEKDKQLSAEETWERLKMKYNVKNDDDNF